MLNAVLSLTRGRPSIQLAHPASDAVYKVDSVNLLVGPSGSGKTRLMVEIIHHLCGNVEEPMFSFDGDLEGMVVIYYSASPFHQGVPIEERKGLPFYDASPGASGLPCLAYRHSRDGAGTSSLEHQLHSVEHAMAQHFKADGASRFLVLIDNADMLLDLEQQRTYLEHVEDRLSRMMGRIGGTSLQIILAAHSPLIASDVFRGSITRLRKPGHTAKDQAGTPEPSDGRIVGFAGTIQSVINYTFETPSVGGVAQRTYLKLQQNAAFSVDPAVIAAEICDDFIRQYVTDPTRRRNS